VPGAGRGPGRRHRSDSLAQQPDASATITRTLFVGLAMIESLAIYCFVVSMILIFANPFWTHAIAQGRGEVSHAHRLVHRRAQALNFLILVWLLKHFLYKPILNAIDAGKNASPLNLRTPMRRNRGAKGARRFRSKNKAFDEQRALFSARPPTSKAERERLIDKARKDADSLRDRPSGRVAKRSGEAGQRDHPHGQDEGLCHRAEDARGPRHGQS
jgi:F-type H+-transporting ATPase subunit c